MSTESASQPRRVRVQFMPGRVAEVAAMESAGLPKYVVCRLALQPNGQYAMVPQTWNQMVRMTRELHAELGLPCSHQTIYKLVYAGFIRGCLLTHRTFLVDLASLADHFQNCELAEGREPFWTPARIQRYSAACQRFRRMDWKKSIFGKDEDEDEDFSPSGPSRAGGKTP